MAQDLHGEAAPGITRTIAQQSSSRLLRRHSKRTHPKTDRRRLQTDESLDDDGNAELNFDDAETSPNSTPEGQSPCKSIIAVGGWRLLASSNDTASSITGDFSYDPMNTVLSYEDKEEVDTG